MRVLRVKISAFLRKMLLTRRVFVDGVFSADLTINIVRRSIVKPISALAQAMPRIRAKPTGLAAPVPIQERRDGIIDAAIQNERWTDALAMHFAQKPPAETTKSLLLGLLKNGRFDDACHLYDRLDYTSHLDKQIYHLLISGHLLRSDMHQAMRLYQHMRFSGFVPPAPIYQQLIEARLENRNVAGAFRLVRDMIKYGLQPTEQVIHSLALAQIDSGNMNAALDTLKLIPTPLSRYNELLRACMRASSVDGCLSVYYLATSQPDTNLFRDRKLVREMAIFLARNQRSDATVELIHSAARSSNSSFIVRSLSILLRYNPFRHY